MTNERERRFRRHAELRVDPDRPTLIVGCAVVYNSPSEDLAGFTEIIKPGAFAESLKTADVRALVDHDASRLLGRTRSGTLRLDDRPDGLWVEIDIPNTSYARDLVENVGRGDMDGMSFGFVATDDRWDQADDGSITRTVLKADIFDVSCVTYPAYPETTLALRSRDAWLARPARAARRDGPNQLLLMLQELREKSFRPAST